MEKKKLGTLVDYLSAAVDKLPMRLGYSASKYTNRDALNGAFAVFFSFRDCHPLDILVVFMAVSKFTLNFMKGYDMKTVFVKPEDAGRKWFLLDADGKVMGRIAARVASILRGKEKAVFAPHLEVGDYVVVINAGKAVLTGNKVQQKQYHRHTGYPGGLKTVNYAKMIEKHPTSPLELAIKGMLPKGPLGRKLLKNVKIYSGAEHPHAAQNLQKLEM